MTSEYKYSLISTTMQFSERNIEFIVAMTLIFNFCDNLFVKCAHSSNNLTELKHDQTEIKLAHMLQTAMDQDFEGVISRIERVIGNTQTGLCEVSEFSSGSTENLKFQPVLKQDGSISYTNFFRPSTHMATDFSQGLNFLNAQSIEVIKKSFRFIYNTPETTRVFSPFNILEPIEINLSDHFDLLIRLVRIFKTRYELYIEGEIQIGEIKKMLKARPRQLVLKIEAANSVVAGILVKNWRNQDHQSAVFPSQRVDSSKKSDMNYKLYMKVDKITFEALQILFTAELEKITVKYRELIGQGPIVEINPKMQAITVNEIDESQLNNSYETYSDDRIILTRFDNGMYLIEFSLSTNISNLSFETDRLPCETLSLNFPNETKLTAILGKCIGVQNLNINVQKIQHNWLFVIRENLLGLNKLNLGAPGVKMCEDFNDIRDFFRASLHPPHETKSEPTDGMEPVEPGNIQQEDEKVEYEKDSEPYTDWDRNLAEKLRICELSSSEGSLPSPTSSTPSDNCSDRSARMRAHEEKYFTKNPDVAGEPTPTKSLSAEEYIRRFFVKCPFPGNPYCPMPEIPPNNPQHSEQIKPTSSSHDDYLQSPSNFDTSPPLYTSPSGSNQSSCLYTGHTQYLQSDDLGTSPVFVSDPRVPGRFIAVKSTTSPSFQFSAANETNTQPNINNSQAKCVF